MSGFGSMEWFNDLKERANSNAEFQKAARWFRGAIGWRIMNDGYRLVISEGQIKTVESGLGGTVFTMSGNLEDWRELLAKGTINRLFRQQRIRIEGDKIEAMRYWKILWHLTEISRSIQ